jgi:2-methylcitrate dehydratase PrpD
MSKRIHPGKSAETGLTAAVLARRGVTGPRAVLETAWGGLFPTYLGDVADPRVVVKDLGQGFRILRKGFKPYPVCWGINSAADGLLRLRAEHGLTAGTVRRIRVVVSEMSRRMVGGTRIDSVLDAQMSVAYALAWILLRGRLTLAEFDEAALADPAAREVMRRIELVVDPAAHGEQHTVEVETHDGRRLRGRVETNRGHWTLPLSDGELREKFLGLAGPVLGARAAEAADLVGEVARPGALGRLLALLGAGAA